MTRSHPALWRRRLATWLCVIGLIALLPHQLGGHRPQPGHGLPELMAGMAAELCLAHPDQPEPD